MSRSLDRITEIAFDCQRTLGEVSKSYVLCLATDINNFLKATDDLSKQQKWRCWFVGAVGVGGGFSQMVTGMIPKSNPAAPSAVNPRLNAHNGITDPISNALKGLQEKLSDNNFLRSAAKGVSQALTNGVGPAGNSLFESRSTKIDAKRQILQTNFQNEQSGKSGGESTKTAIDQSLQRIFQSQINAG